MVIRELTGILNSKVISHTLRNGGNFSIGKWGRERGGKGRGELERERKGCWREYMVRKSKKEGDIEGAGVKEGRGCQRRRGNEGEIGGEREGGRNVGERKKGA